MYASERIAQARVTCGDGTFEKGLGDVHREGGKPTRPLAGRESFDAEWLSTPVEATSRARVGGAEFGETARSSPFASDACSVELSAQLCSCEWNELSRFSDIEMLQTGEPSLPFVKAAALLPPSRHIR